MVFANVQLFLSRAFYRNFMAHQISICISILYVISYINFWIKEINLFIRYKVKKLNSYKTTNCILASCIIQYFYQARVNIIIKIFLLIYIKKKFTRVWNWIDHRGKKYFSTDMLQLYFFCWLSSTINGFIWEKIMMFISIS